MIELLISLIVTLIILGVVWWAVTTIIGILPMPAPIKQVVNVLLILVLCLIVIYSLLPFLHMGRFRLGSLNPMTWIG